MAGSSYISPPVSFHANPTSSSSSSSSFMSTAPFTGDIAGVADDSVRRIELRPELQSLSLNDPSTNLSLVPKTSAATPPMTYSGLSAPSSGRPMSASSAATTIGTTTTTTSSVHDASTFANASSSSNSSSSSSSISLFPARHSPLTDSALAYLNALAQCNPHVISSPDHVGGAIELSTTSSVSSFSRHLDSAPSRFEAIGLNSTHGTGAKNGGRTDSVLRTNSVDSTSSLSSSGGGGGGGGVRAIQGGTSGRGSKRECILIPSNKRTFVNTDEPIREDDLSMIIVVKNNLEGLDSYQVDQFGRIVATAPSASNACVADTGGASSSSSAEGNDSTAARGVGDRNARDRNALGLRTPSKNQSAVSVSSSGAAGGANGFAGPGGAGGAGPSVGGGGDGTLAGRLRDRDVVRELKWMKMLGDWDNVVRHKTALLKKRIRKGIPPSLRGVMWPYLAGVNERKKRAEKLYLNNQGLISSTSSIGGGGGSGGVVEEEKKKHMPLQEITPASSSSSSAISSSTSSSSSSSDATGTSSLSFYQQLLLKEARPSDDIQIRKDLPRLFQDHVLFRSPEAGSRHVMCPGQAALYNVLRAYSVYDPEVGYVQGMDSIAGPALMYMSEEDTFWYLESLLQSPAFNLRSLYTDSMPLAHKYMYVHTRLVERHFPQLHALFEARDIAAMTYAFRWYSLRYSQFAPELACRVLDVYLAEGDKVLYRVALALLRLKMKKILEADADFELLPTLRDIECDHDWHRSQGGDLVMNTALSINVSAQTIAKYSAEFDVQYALHVKNKKMREKEAEAGYQEKLAASSAAAVAAAAAAAAASASSASVDSSAPSSSSSSSAPSASVANGAGSGS